MVGISQFLAPGQESVTDVMQRDGLSDPFTGEAMGIQAESIEVTAEGDLDLQGTLGISKEAPVGFESIRTRFDIQAPDATSEQLEALREKTEQYCVVFQTLVKPPRLETEWT